MKTRQNQQKNKIKNHRIRRARRTRGKKTTNTKKRINEKNIEKHNILYKNYYNKHSKNILNFLIKRNNNENIIQKFGMTFKNQLTPSKYKEIGSQILDCKCIEFIPKKIKINQFEILYYDNKTILLSLASFDFNIYQISHLA